MTSSFNFSNFDTLKVVGFFDFRSLLWSAEEMHFEHSSCFEPLACVEVEASRVNCDYLYHQRRSNCSEIYETKIELGGVWHHTELPVNKYLPKVFDSSGGRSKELHLSKDPRSISIVIEDLDGMGASVKVTD